MINHRYGIAILVMAWMILCTAGGLVYADGWLLGDMCLAEAPGKRTYG